MSSLSSNVMLVVLLLAVLVQALLVAGQCPNGADGAEITTPGLIDGVVIPETGSLIQQPADTLTLWPISLSLLPAYQGNITAFVAALGVCEAPTGCAVGEIQLGLYHFHVVGTVVPSEAGKFHLISYSDPITYHPHSTSGTSTHAKYKSAKAHAQKPTQQVIPSSFVNALDGYYIGIISTVPYGVYTGGVSFLPYYLTLPTTKVSTKGSGRLPTNPALIGFSESLTATEAALGFFYCPGQ